MQRSYAACRLVGVGTMGARRRWTATALLLLAAEVVAVLWLELAFGLNSLSRQALFDGVWIAVSAFGALVPSALGSSLGALVTFLGFGWFIQRLVLPAFAGGPGAGASTLGGALVAPVYLAVRRVFLTPEQAGRSASREPATLRARMAKALEAIRPASTSVQESL